MDIARIVAILDDCTGEIGSDQQPLEGSELVNLYVGTFVLKTDKVKEHTPEMVELLKEWPSTTWGHDVPPLGREINYITAGGVLDSQHTALLLFAFGKVADLWDILDPHSVLRLDYDDDLGQSLAGAGMVSIDGYRPPTGD